MNTDRLLHACTLANELIARTEAQSQLDTMIDALQRIIQRPQDNGAQQNRLAAALKELARRIESIETEPIAPADRRLLAALGVDSVIGQKLASRVQAATSGSSVTPALALEQLKAINTELASLTSAVTSTLNGLRRLGLHPISMEADRCEIAVTIPRVAVNHRLADFASEVKYLGRLTDCLSELVGVESSDTRIAAVSSSELEVYISVGAAVAAAVGAAIDRILGLYKNVLEIKKLREGMTSRNVPEEALRDVDRHADTEMERGIDELLTELLNEFQAADPSGRRNELRTLLKDVLNGIANRLDRGFNFEIRVELPAETEEGAATPNKELLERAYRAAERIQFIDAERARILHLPEQQSDGSGSASRY